MSPTWVAGKVSGGKVVVEVPADWPEGTPVVVEPADEPLGLSEDEQGDDPESVARWIAWMNGLQPFLSPEDEAAWRQARAEQKGQELAGWDDRGRRADGLFR